MKIYEHDGKKYVETGEVSNRGSHRPEGTPFLQDSQVCFCAWAGGWTVSGSKILRLATPEEIAGTEKMCPAGCGARYGQHASHLPTCPCCGTKYLADSNEHAEGCAWFVAHQLCPNIIPYPDKWMNFFADTHWRTIEKIQPVDWPMSDVRAALLGYCGKHARRWAAALAADLKLEIPEPPGVFRAGCPTDRRAEHVPIAKAWVNPASREREMR